MNVMMWIVVCLLCEMWIWNFVVSLKWLLLMMSFMWDVNLEFCRFFEVIVIDDDYDNDFDDGDLLLMLNSYMQNDGDLMVIACMKNVGEVLF